MRDEYECSVADDCTCVECRPDLWFAPTCVVCGEPAETDEYVCGRPGGQWAHQRCDDKPTPAMPRDPATLDLFASEATDAPR
jgi:hypothetical protein